MKSSLNRSDNKIDSGHIEGVVNSPFEASIKIYVSKYD